MKEILITTPVHAGLLQSLTAPSGISVLSIRFSNLLQSNVAVLEHNDTRDTRRVLADLQSRSVIVQNTPNDRYTLQEGAIESSRYVPDAMKLDSLRGALTGKGIRVAIIDTAIQRDHPALQGAIMESFNGLPGSPVEQTSHGTAIAGLIAGRTTLRGLAPDVRLFVARAFDGPAKDKLHTDTFVLLACLDWAIANRATIVNMSFAGPANAIFEAALESAASRGALLVAAAGNNGPKAGRAYPAAYPSTTAVTATDVDATIYSQANRGDYIVLAAPGVDILAPVADSRIEFVSGTSYAAALVSGAAALAAERDPYASAQAAANILISSARDLGAPGRDDIFGYGAVDLSGLSAPEMISSVPAP